MYACKLHSQLLIEAHFRVFSHQTDTIDRYTTPN